ncbi:hypothetical protein [Methylobacterium tardum]|uniref:Uncharacterized protein n=1 Tax=Methylobacterium tardum TaxID=374432 RepID=A0AA37TMB6_9HYPH|nr:hypothetical protein [Methylobacterium tardum]URD40246.1 hypothetical protein M6G65_22085 [Methylobacterium tardum]GLS73519.1 hypothetical protein GCM10007890_55340 [Methylobacterium tardum]
MLVIGSAVREVAPAALAVLVVGGWTVLVVLATEPVPLVVPEDVPDEPLVTG